MKKLENQHAGYHEFAAHFIVSHCDKVVQGLLAIH